MPTYGYQCSACDSYIEVFQKISDPPLTDCSCGQQGSLRKRMFPVGITFKGSGFYVNDYARSSGSSAAETPAKADPAAKTESKPAAEPKKAEPAGAAA